jgi:hypothetical protein
MAMPGYSVDCATVTPDTVLAMATLPWGLPGQISAVSDIMVSGLPHFVFTITVDDDDLMLPRVAVGTVDYPLRL